MTKKKKKGQKKKKDNKEKKLSLQGPDGVDFADKGFKAANINMVSELKETMLK
jgi:hypothetical protein